MVTVMIIIYYSIVLLTYIVVQDLWVVRIYSPK